MKLHVFDNKALQEWIDTGYDNVNITSSDNLGLDDTVSNESFFLLEPFLDNKKAGNYGSVVAISSPKIKEIITAGSGRYYK